MNTINIQKFELQKNKLLIGIDEVGRGSLIGPVITCCVSIFLSDENDINDFKSIPYIIDDSKKIKKETRKKIIEWIKDKTYIKYSIGSASVEEIDNINIRNANNLAMNRSIHSHLSYISYNDNYLDDSKIICYIDGNYFKEVEYIYPNNLFFETLIKGDTKNIAIALASIIAKEYRDDLITNLSIEFPNYEWHKNMGYGTKKHFNYLKEYGITKYHRMSFLKKFNNNN